VIHRYYTTPKADSKYRRRISWATLPANSDKHEQASLIIVEYQGTFPGKNVHGNVQNATSVPYVRTKVEAMEKVGELARNGQRPTDIYNVVANADDVYGISSRHQISQKKRYDRLKSSGAAVSTNFGDQILHIESLVGRSDFVRAVMHLGGRVPSIVLYTDQQIKDIRQFCIEHDNPVVLGVDKTYNLCDMFVTVTVYKSLRVIAERTGANPIFIGPVMLHSQSDAQQYHSFLSHLASLLSNSNLRRLTIGSDDERALRLGIKSAFPVSATVLCVRHLQQNLIDYLRDKVY